MTTGALTTVGTWLLASAGYALYVSYIATYNATYGAFAGAVILLLWIWLGAVAFLYGAELDAVLEERSARRRALGRVGWQAGWPSGSELPHCVRGRCIARGGEAAVERRSRRTRQRSSFMAGPRPNRGEPVSGWALGGITFAACVLTLIGAFQAIAGLTAIFDDNFFVVTRHYTFDLDTTGWGWIHLLIGVLLVATGFGLFGRQAWAGVTAIFLASLSAIANFFFIPYYPFWAILLIALDVWVIWALTRPGAIET